MLIKYEFRFFFDLKLIFQAHLSCGLCLKPSFTVNVMQPFGHEFRRIPAGLRADKTQAVAAQDAFVRVRAQERLHKCSEARLLRFFPLFHLQGFIHLRQQLAPFPVG